MRNIIYEKSHKKCGGETSPRPFSEKIKLEPISGSIALYSLFLLKGKLRVIEIYLN